MSETVAYGIMGVFATIAVCSTWLAVALWLDRKQHERSARERMGTSGQSPELREAFRRQLGDLSGDPNVYLKPGDKRWR